MQPTTKTAVRVREALVGRTPNGSGWHRVNCPFCPEKVGVNDRAHALAANERTGWFRCWRCNTKGFYIEGLSRVEMVEAEKAPRTLTPIDLPPSFRPLADAVGGSAFTLLELGDAINYLLGRGVPFEACVSLGAGFCTDGPCRGRVVIPVDVLGVRVGWVARDIYGRSRLRYIYPTGMPRGEFLFNEDALGVETDEPALLVEGIMDALPYYPHACAFLGKPSDQHVQLLTAAQRPLAVALDGDATIEGWSLAMQLRLDGLSAGHVALPAGRDPNTVDRVGLVLAARRSITEAL